MGVGVTLGDFEVVVVAVVVVIERASTTADGADLLTSGMLPGDGVNFGFGATGGGATGLTAASRSPTGLIDGEARGVTEGRALDLDGEGMLSFSDCNDRFFFLWLVLVGV